VETFVAVNNRLSPEKAQRYGERIAELRRQHQHFNEDVFVEDARDPSSPLHDALEWDDAKCGVLYRREQASYIIRHVGRVIEAPDEAPKVIRAFHRVTTSDGTEDIVTLDEVRNSAAYRDEVLGVASRRLASAVALVHALQSLFTDDARATKKLNRVARHADQATALLASV